MKKSCQSEISGKFPWENLLEDLLFFLYSWITGQCNWLNVFLILEPLYITHSGYGVFTKQHFKRGISSWNILVRLFLQIMAKKDKKVMVNIWETFYFFSIIIYGRWAYFCFGYFRRRNFREQKLSQILPKFAKV